MRSIYTLSALLSLSQAAPSWRRSISSNNLSPFRRDDDLSFTIVDPGSVNDIVITKDNTLNGTYHSPEPIVTNSLRVDDAAPGFLNLEVINNLGLGVTTYITGKDSANKVVFVGQSGTLVYPTSGGSQTPVSIVQPIGMPLGNVGTTTSLNIPISLSSARLYFVQGSALDFFMVKTDAGDGLVQPSVSNIKDLSSGLNWGFVELTYNSDHSLYANISYVDFVGLILSIQLTNEDGSTQLTKGLPADAVGNICNELKAQAAVDHLPWQKLCLANADGMPLRVLAPQDFLSINEQAFETYWDQYIDQVWEAFTTQPLMLATQGDAGNVSCTVANDVMNCAGDNRPFTKPTGNDVWGCNSGPFLKQDGDSPIHLAGISRLCAAFTRSTYLLPGGQMQPSLPAENYYSMSPTSHYARILHKYETDGRGYAFSYDDVNPDGPTDENASGTVSSGKPEKLTVWVGGWK